jgi:hypothetical protein
MVVANIHAGQWYILREAMYANVSSLLFRRWKVSSISMLSALTILTTDRADFLWVDKFTGDVSVWYNQGVKTEADREHLTGSIMEWTPEGKLYNGVDRGANEYFMDYGKFITYRSEYC